MTLSFAAPDTDALPLHLIAQGTASDWAADQSDSVQAWVAASGFDGALGSTLMIPGADGAPAAALAGYGTPKTRARQRFPLAG
ncbi:leucyl aminopeptidase family protein, partial [Litorisediminicola beolgyonensis]